MTIELEILTLSAILTIILWIPYILARVGIAGFAATLMYKSDDTVMPPWVVRAKRAHYNAVENLIPFAILILVAHSIGLSNEVTQSAAIAYFWLRLAHYILHTVGLPFGRTIMFAGSWFAQVCIAYQLIIF